MTNLLKSLTIGFNNLPVLISNNIMKEEVYGLAGIGLAVLTIIFLAASAVVVATSSGSSQNASLTIFDSTDSENRFSNINTIFTANYTNSSGSPLNASIGTGNCTVEFNLSSTFSGLSPMAFNTSTLVWDYNRSFNVKGNFFFRSNCTSTFGNVTLSDNFTIRNTAPAISLDEGNTYVDFDGNKLNDDYFQCTEDSLCSYNFSANVTDPDSNDVLNFNYSGITNTTLTNFTLNSSTGVLTINITQTSLTGSKQVELNVRDSESQSVAGILLVNVSSANDIPQFSGLNNTSFNISTLFNQTYNATDEENNAPFTFNITFVSCSVESWSTRNCSTPEGRSLFNVSNSSEYYTSNTSFTISFVPQKNDVGTYTLNITVKDSLNASRTQTVNFTVTNINGAPTFSYLCNNDRNWNESNTVNCYINVSDIDETANLTVSANVSWFTFSNSTNRTTLEVSSGNASALVNITLNDTHVGRHFINISVHDTGAPIQSNSQIVQFNISNINDSVGISSLSALTVYTTNNYTTYLNASDDDLLIPDKNLYNETLTFSSNASSWVNITSTSIIINTNITSATLTINPAVGGTGTHYVNISVRDANNYSSSSFIFAITVSNNSAPAWNVSTATNLSLTENISFYLNLSQNVTDVDNNTIVFSFANLSSFVSFSLNYSTGVINFTPIDEDVGYHLVVINATDGNVNTSLTFNFSVLNINDAPTITTPLTGTNISFNQTNSNGNTSEDAVVSILLYINDDDLLIPSTQKNYYNESFSVNTTLSGPNPYLFNFSSPTSFGANRTQYSASFTPNRTDLGNYTVTVNITDASNSSTTLSFNITLSSISHVPSISAIGNQTSTYNRTLAIDINASDIEDGTDTGGNTNFTFSYSFINGTDFINNNNSRLNMTTGMFNHTFNDSQDGIYRINITVNDTSGFAASRDFWLNVYNNPTLNTPPAGVNFTFNENNFTNITFIVQHAVGDNLTYIIYIGNNLTYNRSYYGNGTSLNWTFTPNYTMETYGVYTNLTLIVKNPTYADVQSNRTWNLNITHVNSPVNFSSQIQNRSKTILENVTYTLTDYFSDLDWSDERRNETPTFTVNVVQNTTGGISYSVSGSVITFTPPPTPGNGTFTITINDSGTNSTSNSFFIEFSATPTSGTSTTVTTGGGGGGGGGSSGGTNPISLKIILPEPLSLDKRDKILLPITLQNNGQTSLNGITLTSTIAKDGVLKKDIKSSFDRTSILSLSVGEKQGVTLTIETNTEELGLYEISVNASVANPVYRDWGKIYLTVKEGTTVSERILFTEEFIVGNPECLEIRELIDEAKVSLGQGDFAKAEVQIEEALSSCKRAISQRPLPRLARIARETRIISYAAIASIIAFIAGILYYSYRRLQLKRTLDINENYR